MLRFLIFITFCALISAGKVSFTDCGPTHKEMKSVDISACAGGNSCSISAGSTFTLAATFDPIVFINAETITTPAITVEWMAPNLLAFVDNTDDNCKYMTPECPLKKNQTYTATVPVLVSTALKSGDRPGLELNIIDNYAGYPLACARVTVAIS